MRELKFRLLLDGKIVGYEKWYGGSFSFEDKYWIADPCWLYSRDGKTWTPKYIFHDSKEQFTGCHDKNGKDIYEGDIIECEYYPNLPTTKGAQLVWRGHIVYSKDTFYLYRYGEFEGIYAVAYGGSAIKRWEVIGNIHENPELIA